MKAAEEIGTLRRVASARMPTKWGMFDALGFERKISTGSQRTETALALVLGDVTKDPPLLRIHSQCFTGEMLGSLRCDCGKQLAEALSRLSLEGGILIYLRQEGRGSVWMRS